jgi:putative methionine-R-sulfoxide reductase with GAF domain
MKKQADEEIRVRRFWALDPTNHDALMLGTFVGTVLRFGVIINDGIRGFATQAEAAAYLADFRGDGHLVTMVEGPEEGGLPEGWN